MKRSRVILFLLVLSMIAGTASISFAGGGKSDGAWLWPEKKGEICLDVYGPNGVCACCEHLGTVEMYVTQMGDGHYLVLGRSNEATETVPFIGTAEIVEIAGETKVRIHVTASGTSSGDVHGNMTTVILDPVTLSGDHWTLDFHAPKTPLGTPGEFEYNGVRCLSPCSAP